MVDQLPTNRQESLLALLAFNDSPATTQVVAQVTPEIFDAPYQEIATRLLLYRRQYGKAPGKVQIDDLFGWAIEKGERAPRLRRIVSGLLLMDGNLNPDFILSWVGEFIRWQKAKSAIKRSSEIVSQNQDRYDTSEIEVVLNDFLRSRITTLDTGTFLSDPGPMLRYLEDASQTNYIPIGVKELDDIPVVCAPKELLLYIAPKGSGKSWFGTHMGRQGLLHGASVLHITLEMRFELLQARYYQCLFGLGRYKGRKYRRSTLLTNEMGELTKPKAEWTVPEYALNDPAGRQYMGARIKQWGARLGRIVLKEFPTRSLSFSKLVAYLDYLESKEKFTPNLVIIDYPDLMQLDQRDFRISLGRMYESLRGLAGERNFALVAPTQGNRASLSARNVKADMVAEDVTKVNTADTVLTYSRTKSEEQLGIGRIHVAHARNSEGAQTIVLSQAYPVGQWCLDSRLQTTEYWNNLKLREEGEEA